MVLITEKQLCIIKRRFDFRFFREMNLFVAHERMETVAKWPTAFGR